MFEIRCSIELPEGIDQIYAYLMMDGQIEALVQFGALGKVTRRHWIELILDAVPHGGLRAACLVMSG